jgi:hypothetical protein
MSIEEKSISQQSPGFLRLGKIKPFPLSWMTGIDKYIQGKWLFSNKIILCIYSWKATKGKELDKLNL